MLKKYGIDKGQLVERTDGSSLKLIYSSIDRTLEHLKVINLISEEIESKINVSMENKYLLKTTTSASS